METGRDFLQAQVNNAVMQHRTLLENLEDHQKQAEDQRYRDLCARHVPRMREHQRMLEQYRDSIGTSSATKEAVGTVLGKARDFVDMFRGSDFLRLVGDTVTIRQAQDTFGAFAAVGDQIGEPRLAEIGRRGEQDHQEMAHDFNQLTQQLFVEHARKA